MAPGTEVSAAIGTREFQEVCKLAYEHFGLDLKPGKEALVSARLGKRMRALGIGAFRDYISLVRGDATGSELCALIDSLTTNFTSFLREPAHFDFLRGTILHQFAARASMAIWCAGCATGEEPYSVAFHLVHHWGLAQVGRARILATDISTRALERASLGVYPQDRFHDVPREWLPNIVQRGSGQWAGQFRVRPELRSIVEFRRLNLMESFDSLPKFPVIFCRNVMIYFDKATQESLVRRFAGQLEPGGYLLIGHSEGLMGISHGLEYVQPAVYRRPGKPNAAPPTRRSK